MKTSKLKGVALTWAVASREGLLGYGYKIDGEYFFIELSTGEFEPFNASFNWEIGGSIIEREKIELEHDGFEWWARIEADEDYSGKTPLIAAMRCYVASKLGDEVEVPEELMIHTQEITQ